MQSLVKSFLHRKLEEGAYSAGQILVARSGEILADLSMGSKVSGSEEEKVSSSTLFNIESITKVMVTVPLVFKMIEQGKLRLDDKVMDYIPLFGSSQEKKRVTVRELLNFTAGISPDDPHDSLEMSKKDPQKAWELHYSQDLQWEPGTRVFYSDNSCRVLGKVLEKVMGVDLNEGARNYIFDPLKMNRTMFNPPAQDCVSTGFSDSGRVLRGSITQDLEHNLGEVLGSDGLFSTSRDMFVFSQMLLNEGVFHGTRVLGKATISRMIGDITNEAIYEKPSSYLEYILSGPKMWMWEAASCPYSFFGDLVSRKSIGKMGGAGTFLLIDPQYELVLVYLTNYGQPEVSLEGDESWGALLHDIDVMGLCNMVLSQIW